MPDTIVVIGDAILDRYYEGTVTDISQEAPVPKLDTEVIYDVPGGAANVAKMLVALGNKVHFVTLLGGNEDDMTASSLQERLETAPYVVTVHAYNDPNYRTPLKNRLVDAFGKHIARFDVERDNYEMSKKVRGLLVDEVIGLLNKKRGNAPVSCLVLSDYGKGVLSSDIAVKEILGEASRLKIPVVVDPKHKDLSRYTPATIITPNLFEAQLAVGAPDDSIESAARLMDKVRNAKVQGVLVKDGQDGGVLAQVRKDNSIRARTIPAYPAREVFDGTGAGDVITAVLAHELKCTPEEYDDLWFDLDDACRRASIAAGEAVSTVGTSFIDITNYEQALADNGRLPQIKLCSLDVLKGIVESSRNAGERIVFTNGCFDMLHPGHVKLLQTARSMGDMLVVGMNSDASVARLKGKARPFIPEEHRAKMLEAVECVDVVVIFDEDTPERLIQEITPDVLVKGSEWQNDMKKIAGAMYVLESGGSVAFVEQLEDYSTTKLMGGLTLKDK